MRLIIALSFLLFPLLSFSQFSASELLKGKSSVTIPFEFQNNFIILDVVFNDILPLKFIFDTGAEHTILTKREFADVLHVDYSKRFNIIGVDREEQLYANIANNINLRFNDITFDRQNILVLEEDYLGFEKYAGTAIHGIIGGQLFRQFIIKIDYKNKNLILQDFDTFKAPTKKYQTLALEIFRNKPYITISAKLNKDHSIPLKLLVDTGAGLTLLLHEDTNEAIDLPLNVIPGNLGSGLGGLLNGYLGRVNQLNLDELYFNNLLTYFQKVEGNYNLEHLNGRNGILGNVLLSRFYIIFDYIRGNIYLKPSKKYNKSLQFDKSGLSIFATGKNFNTFIINDVMKNSPAELAGLKKGDIIKRINGLSARFLDLQIISAKLQKKEGKRIKLVIKREEKKIKKIFRLKKLI